MSKTSLEHPPKLHRKRSGRVRQRPMCVCVTFYCPLSLPSSKLGPSKGLEFWPVRALLRGEKQRK